MKSILKITILSTFLTGMFIEGQNANANQLLNEAHFSRCYKFLTQRPLEPDNSILAEIKNGQKTSDEACLELLRYAKLTFTDDSATTKVPYYYSRKVLDTMHRLHSTWFSVREWFTIAGGQAMRGTASMRDTTSPASYYTRALFDDNEQWTVDKVVTFDKTIVPIRRYHSNHTGRLAWSHAKHENDDGSTRGIWLDHNIYIPYGDVDGIKTRAQKQYNWNRTLANGDVQNGSRTMAAHQGGGFLGSPDYLLMTIQNINNFKGNGVGSVARKWSKAILSDALCRELPVVNASDAEPFVHTESDASFRHSSTCAACHTTIDRMAGTIRRISFGGISAVSPQIGGDFLKFWPTDKGPFVPKDSEGNDLVNPKPEDFWQAKNDQDYAHRPTLGHFIYRSISGELTDIKVESIAELGTAISKEKDFYRCIAYRYYQHFTGYHFSFAKLAEKNHIHSKRVNELADSLFQHKRPIKTVESILTSSYFKATDYIGTEGEVK